MGVRTNLVARVEREREGKRKIFLPKMKQLITCLVIQLCHSSVIFINNSERPACSETEVCKPLSECPGALTSLKENQLRPKLCSFQIRSVSICCNKTDLKPSSEKQRCGVRNTAETFLEVSPNISDAQLQELIELNDGQMVLHVVGGGESEQNSLPWMAALGQKAPPLPAGVDWFCGGAYIGERLVLTAAHCIPEAASPRKLDLVRLGGHDLSLEHEVGAVDYGVERIFIHPSFSPATPHLNDIAILVLDHPVSQSEVSPVCLPSPDDEELLPGSPLTVAGWGARNERTGDYPDKLHEVAVEFSDQTSCAASYRQTLGVDIGKDVLCAGHPQGGHDACAGDSGGALLHQNPSTGVWRTVGIVSAGRGCGRREFPGLYTSLTSYLPWVDQVRQLLLQTVEVELQN